MLQGDINSQSTWKAELDILPRAIGISEIEGALRLVEADTLHTQNEMASVDDLISVVASKKALQQMSDVAYVFCAIFCMSMAPANLRCFQLNY